MLGSMVPHEARHCRYPRTVPAYVRILMMSGRRGLPAPDKDVWWSRLRWVEAAHMQIARFAEAFFEEVHALTVWLPIISSVQVSGVPVLVRHTHLERFPAHDCQHVVTRNDGSGAGIVETGDGTHSSRNGHRI